MRASVRVGRLCSAALSTSLVDSQEPITRGILRRGVSSLRVQPIANKLLEFQVRLASIA